MSALFKVVSEHMAKLKTVAGATFYGQFLDIPDTTRVSNFNSARRLLRVKPNSLLKKGDNFYDHNGQIFLAAEHGDQFLRGKHLYTHFKLFEMPAMAAVGKKGAKVRHPVTTLEVEGPTVWQQGIHLAFELRSTGSDAIGVPINRQQIITGYPVEEGDLVHLFGFDEQATVKRVDQQLGVYVAQIDYE